MALRETRRIDVEQSQTVNGDRGGHGKLPADVVEYAGREDLRVRRDVQAERTGARNCRGCEQQRGSHNPTRGRNTHVQSPLGDSFASSKTSSMRSALYNERRCTNN